MGLIFFVVVSKESFIFRFLVFRFALCIDDLYAFLGVWINGPFFRILLAFFFCSGSYLHVPSLAIRMMIDWT